MAIKLSHRHLMGKKSRSLGIRRQLTRKLKITEPLGKWSINRERNDAIRKDNPGFQ